MCECCKNIRWGKVLLCAVIFTVIAQVIHMISAQLSMSFYMDPSLMNIWSKLMMPKEGPPPPSFFIFSILLSFVTGVILAKLYDFMRKSGVSFMCFFMTILALSIVFGSLPMLLCVNVPIKLQLIWFLETVVIYLVSFMIFAKIMK